jgi:multiple sugar transport system permease protein
MATVRVERLVRRNIGSVGIHLVLAAGCVVMAFPLLYGLLAGLSTLPEYETAVFIPIPHHLSLNNLWDVFNGADFGVMFRNTALRAAWYGFFPTLLALVSGFAFARLRFPGRRAAFLLLLASLMVPGQVSIVPLYIMVARWPLVGGNDLWGQGGTGMLNTWWALLALGLVNAYAIFLIKQSIESVPIEYDEAARIDGAHVLRIIFQIHLPMLKPVVATLAILQVIGTWNDYWVPLIFASDNPDLNTVALGATNFVGAVLVSGQPNFPLLFMGSTVAMLPTILIFMFFQRYLVQGFAMTGIKG